VILANTLRLEFSTRKPLDGSPHNPDALPVATVYRNGALTLLAPVIANLATGRYELTLPLTAANGFVLGDWVSVVVAFTIDGLMTRRVVFEDSMTVAGYGPAMILNQTIYPLFTVHRPCEGGAQNFDATGAAPAAVVYINGVLTALAPAVVNVGVVGLYMVTLALTPANGFAVGSEFSIIVTSTAFAATVDGIGSECTITGGVIVAGGGGGGGVVHHEVIDQGLGLR